MEMIKNFIVSAAETNTVQTPPSDWMVVAMGIGVVFIGLVLIIIICKIMGLFFADSERQEATAEKPVATTANKVIENRQEIIAAVTAACAEDMGKDVSAIRVISFKKI